MKFKWLPEVCLLCGIDPNVFEQEKGFLDKILVELRNKIAQGESIPVNRRKMEEIINRTVPLIRKFGEENQNLVAAEFIWPHKSASLQNLRPIHFSALGAPLYSISSGYRFVEFADFRRCRAIFIFIH